MIRVQTKGRILGGQAQGSITGMGNAGSIRCTDSNGNRRKHHEPIPQGWAIGWNKEVICSV
jgi:hypothetical protein